MEGVAPATPESSGTPPILGVHSSPIPAPGNWAKPKTREEKRAEMQAKWNVQREKEKEEQHARDAAYEAEGERRRKVSEARRIELQRAAEGKKQADLEASTLALQRRERIQEQNEERRKAEWDRLQTIQTQQEQEHRREQEAIMKATPTIAYVPSIVTPGAARQELESLVAAHSPPSEQTATEASGVPITQAASATPLKAGQLESVLAARVQNLKERAGDYSSYLPSHFGVGRAPGQERVLGHVAYAQLALAKSRGVSLDRRHGAVKIIERFPASKELGSEA
ncbi:hypothetical protein FIBSPDRAFT_855828 [Athelia psychrophila]|uniref:Uncharacterized protein n=1 Tax=Athelia psychrophila TaxID=1759441 RepID=A0A166NR40_9AGAM|nr:hypothetical protein FIBSPDRAFT_855828 [Fibularhizoctonia sp. CBS 109695]